jgi:BirA family biotin operon repressor/biotin-[acetyl-CoA-carboxylase] ligase
MTTRHSSARNAGPALLDQLSGGQTISGSELGARLGISRAAVWKQVDRLRELGLGVVAQAGHGYRLDAPFEALDAASIHAELAPATRARLGDLAVHWQIDSTSNELLRRRAGDPRDPLVCVAELQSAGRGRRGRSWRTPLGGGLALSVLKRFDRGMAELAGLSLVAGVAAIEALDDRGIAEIGLKWPNDLVAREAKLGGILVELGGDALGPCHAVIGIGINLRLDAGARAAIDQPCIDLATLTGVPVGRNALAARLITRLIDALDRFEQVGFAGFADAYARHDVLHGRPVQVLRAGVGAEGVACGVDRRGALRVAFADGEQAIDSGEVSIRMRA